MAEFDPGQLDQLEDALEHIDDLDDLESLELSAALSERLGEYQDVLALCHEAFPLEEPAPALLADVIAEAHEVSRRPRRDVEASAWQRFWERWRGTLIPGFALAGTAAAVLWIIGPEQQLASNDTPSASEDRRAEQPSKPAGEALEPDAIDTTAPASGNENDADEDPTTEAGEGPGEGPGEALEQVDPSPQGKKPKAKPKPEPTIAPEPEPEPLNKDEAWSQIGKGDSARTRGDCDQAIGFYETVTTSSDTSARAQAYAGIGLCHEQAQRYGEADTWFQKARATKKGIDSWINNQRDQQPMPGEIKKKKKRTKTKVPDKKKAGAVESL